MCEGPVLPGRLRGGDHGAAQRDRLGRPALALAQRREHGRQPHPRRGGLAILHRIECPKPAKRPTHTGPDPAGLDRELGMAQHQLRPADRLVGGEPSGGGEGMMTRGELAELRMGVAKRLPQRRALAGRHAQHPPRLERAPVRHGRLGRCQVPQRGVPGPSRVAERAVVVPGALEVQRQHGVVAAAPLELETGAEMETAAGPEREPGVRGLPHDLPAEAEEPLSVGLDVAVQPGPGRRVRRLRVLVEHQPDQGRVECAPENGCAPDERAICMR